MRCCPDTDIDPKHLVNEHHVIRKSHDATQEKCPHVVHFNVPCDWFETCGIKNVTLKAAKKKSWVSRSTGKRNMLSLVSRNSLNRVEVRNIAKKSSLCQLLIC